MRLAGLLSGGKDSVYAAYLAQKQGHTLEYLVSLRSENPDSYMFHTVNIDLTELQAEAWGIQYLVAETKGIKEEELQDLKKALKTLDIDGVKLLEKDGWVILRASNTEPVIRISAEARTEEKLRELYDFASRELNQVLKGG